MGLFGGGGKSVTSSMSRPDYLMDYINQLTNQIGQTNSGDYVNREYAGLNETQQQALQQLADSGALGALSSQYLQAGQSGLNDLNYANNQLNDLYNQGAITGDQISSLANQLYNQEDVQAAIDAQNAGVQEQLARQTQPAIAEMYGGQAGHGSGQRVAKDFAQGNALQQMQSNAADITNASYNSALNQAQNILSGNKQNQAAALSGLTQQGGQMAGLGVQAGNIAQQQIQNQWNAGLQQQQDIQNQYNNNYQNQVNSQNWGWNDIQNQIGAAGVLNGALGQKTTTTASGGGSGFLGGAMSGAAAGSAFGPWGALAGGVIGGLASS